MELKRGGNRANNPSTQTEQTGLTTLPQSGSKVSGKNPPHQRSRDEDDANSNDCFESSNEDDHVFLLLEAGSAFIETVFKSKMNVTLRRW